ncbi:phage distal tail protein [Embleya sp. NPDC059237]|uniref:phage distal tail protein n=1 Tax=Embleya sp. NPDC059237 TaxID=3346784 RepID=UPI00369B3842
MAGELVTGPGLIQFRDLVLGPDPLRWRGLDGWQELPSPDDASVPRSGQHGSMPGPLLAQARTVTLDVLMRVAGDPGEVVDRIERATALTDEETPLVVWLDSRGPRMVFGRVVRCRIPVDRAYRIGTVVGIPIQWSCSDPRRYELVEQTATTKLPQAEGGLTFPLTFPLDWGTPAVSGTLTAVNSGYAPTSPVVEFVGPVDTPAMVRMSDGVRLEYDLVLGAGETLTVDTRSQSVRLAGADRLYAATSRSVPEEWFRLEPGATDLAFRAASGSTDPAASMTVRWRSAFW